MTEYRSASKITEFVVAILLIVIFVVAIMNDLTNCLLPNIMLIRASDTESLVQTLFEVQAATSAISIALVALLSDSIKDEKYGISTSRYVMQIRPYIFKHSRIIFFSLFIIAINYLFVSMQLFNSSIFIFFTSILLMIIMIKDIIKLFTERENIYDEMRQYVIYSYRDERLTLQMFRKAIVTSTDLQSTLDFNENIQMLNSLFSEEFTKNDDRTEKLQEIENICIDAAIISFKRKDISFCIKWIDLLYEVYKLANEQNSNKPIFIMIWDGLAYDIFKVIPSINPELLLESKFFALHNLLYINQNYKFNQYMNKDVPENIYELEYWSIRTYYALFIKNQERIQPNIEYRIKKRLFEDVARQIKYQNHKFFACQKKEIATQELSNYIKACIEHYDIKLLNDCFFDDYFFLDNVYCHVVIIILIYLYYLSDREDLIKENELCSNAKKFINDNKDIIQHFLSNYFYVNSSKLKTYLDEYKLFLHRWEIMPEKRAKFIIMDYVVEDFIIWSISLRFWIPEQSYNILSEIIGDNAFVYTDRYFDQNYKESFLKYKDFAKMLYHISDQQIEISYAKLEADIKGIYKMCEIEKGKREASKYHETEFENKKKIEEMVMTLTDEVFGYFDTVKSFNRKKYKVDRNDITLLETSLPISFLDEYINDNIQRDILDGLVFALLKISSQSLKTQEVNVMSDTKLSVFFDAVQNLDNLNLIIGNCDIFRNDQSFEDLKKYMIGKNVIQLTSRGDRLYAINTEKLHIKIEKITADLSDHAENEIIHNCKIDDKGNLTYNITNSIYIPFDKEEIISYVHNTRKRLTITATISYHKSPSLIGGGIIVKFDHINDD